jgi:hypothetical protein
MGACVAVIGAVSATIGGLQWPPMIFKLFI